MQKALSLLPSTAITTMCMVIADKKLFRYSKVIDYMSIGFNSILLVLLTHSLYCRILKVLHVCNTTNSANILNTTNSENILTVTWNNKE
jgi:hypothetical protein